MQRPPLIENRPARLYVGTGAVIPMSSFEREIPAMIATISAWLNGHGLPPTGKPFLRYRVIDMPERMDVELGMPVNHAPDANGAVRSDVLPAGRYAVTAYRGVKNAMSANRALIEWIADQGEQMDHHASERGEVFAARYETFLFDPSAGASEEEAETEIAIRLRDGGPSAGI